MVPLPEWLVNLSSLQKLYVVDCEKLMYLPTEQAMQRLSKLEKLMIYDCPKLNNEQSRINHIPLVQINTHNAGGAHPFYGKLNGSFLEQLSKLGVMFLTVCFERDTAARVDVSPTPSWDVRLDDDEGEEDAEFFAAPAFESKLAPKGYKEISKHNPRAIHKNFGKHVLESTVNLTIKKKNRCLQA
ncbi:hypothetical protein SO802_022332 [Lithocarpus litseifolius]|uniref:Uncharacterized protein n=1 Tax=Lithocarpus litseifolius TaxID=425828 RepID=A0AAW2CIM4_9ROSI